VFDSLSGWVVDVINAIGYVGVALLVALENLFPPIPSEIVLPFAGFTSGQGEASFPGMVVAATVGSLAGAWILYLVAAWIGPVRLRALFARYERFLRITPQDLDRAEGWFDRHSRSAVLICRCIPLIRSLVSIPAGFRRMSPLWFTVLTVLGSLVWNTALIGAGHLLGARWKETEDVVSVFQYVVIAAILAAVAWFVWKRFLQPRRAATVEVVETSSSGTNTTSS
jgi:membrane protein DedA with SNARE-associated domain